MARFIVAGSHLDKAKPTPACAEFHRSYSRLQLAMAQGAKQFSATSLLLCMKGRILPYEKYSRRKDE